jgi:uncharacterized protein
MAAEGVKPAPWGHATVNRLAGERLHLNHGPIDLIIRAEGDIADVNRAYTAAHERFQTVLGELVGELAELRKPLGKTIPQFNSPIANRMLQACWPHRETFITPMAAVAGSVADEMKHVMMRTAPHLRTLYINNGGDIAVHIAESAVLKIGLVSDLTHAMPDGVVTITHASGVGGIATSGWRGRSFSMGVADAVTVVARTAAGADAAATMIANAVDVQSASIKRASAMSLDPDSDLGNQLVTTDVGLLTKHDIDQALLRGEATALRLLKSAYIEGFLIALQGETRLNKNGSKQTVSVA